MANPDRRRGQLADVRTFMGKVFGADMHAKRIDSLAGATLGVMQSAFFAVAMIGQALALAKGLVTKRAIKQIDPMPKNNGIDVWDSQLARRQAAGGRRQAPLVAMDRRRTGVRRSRRGSAGSGAGDKESDASWFTAAGAG